MKKWMKIIAVLTILGVLGAVALYVFVYNKPHPSYAKLPKLSFHGQTKAFYNLFCERLRAHCCNL